MTYARCSSISLRGIDAEVLTIEASRDAGLPSVTVVAQFEHPYREIRDRVRAAITNSASSPEWPSERLTISTSPQHLPLTSAHDLGVAVAVLTSELGVSCSDRVAFIAELGLDGRLRPVRGILAAVLGAREAGIDTVVVAEDALAHLVVVEGVTVLGARDLSAVLRWLHGRASLTSAPREQFVVQPPALDPGWLAGQQSAAFALEVAAAGGHHLGLAGPTGSGKTLLAQCLPALLPPLSRHDALELAAIHSLRYLPETPRIFTTLAPFAAPHHSTSVNALIGGGTGSAYPGSVSLAHHGVLFLDELGEFSRATLEMLRWPLQEREVRIARRDGAVRFPAAFQLVAATSHQPPLTRTAAMIADHIDVWATLSSRSAARARGVAGDSIEAVCERVHTARELAAARWAAHGISTNAEVSAALLRDQHRLPGDVDQPIDAAVRAGNLSLRGADSVRRVAWTVADLRSHEIPTATDVLAARNLRRGLHQQ